MLLFLGFVYLSVSETEDKFRTCSILNFSDIEGLNFKDFDSVSVAASTLYEASFLKQIMQGEQYRKAWAAPMTVPIVYLDTLKGGLKIIEQGGGKQTHSLELEDSLGIRYTLRSVTKNPEPLVPDLAKDLNLENIIIDGISAQHPYAALVVANLADAAKVLHTQPILVFVPKQSELGKFNDKFGNRLFLFEYESEGEVDWTGLPSVVEIVDTEDLQEYKTKYGDAVTIDKNALIRARLFDFIIGDWDRHAKQWGWAVQKNDGSFTATPVAADRDNAFFDQDGVIPKLIANDLTYPEIQDFDETIGNLDGLISTFDEYFLRQATVDQFELEASKLQELLSDDQIEKAFEVWPKTMDDLNGEEIRKKLKSRRDDIPTYASQFYTLVNERPLKKIVLKGSEELQLKGTLSKCFDCTN
ncbi:MAG TPA: hypothetical protein ENH87_10835 [Pricia antarctica]|uniref:Uncharacterized protein n=1 Tax=Pricia antarctica TaxID=641691 RepID=A0A831QNG3_9FLAO|nr:hypothetical protein [Pricia antarctica]